MNASHRSKNPSPETTTNILSKLFFCWVLPFFKYGYKNDLQMGDMYNTRQENMSGFLGDELEKNWKTEIKLFTDKNQSSPSLQKAILKTFGRTYMKFGFWLLVQSLVFRNFQPVILAEYIKYLQSHENVEPHMRWIMGVGVVLVPFMNILIYHHCCIGCLKVGMNVKIACCSLVYRKLLKLNQSSLGKTASGQVVNLLSNDVQRFEEAAALLHFLYVAPIQFIAALYMLYIIIGISCVPGILAVILISIPLQGCLSILQGKLRLKVAHLTDQRVKLMNEVVSGIQVIKMYAWEKPFENVIGLARKLEIDTITKSAYVKGLSLALVVITEKLSVFLTIVPYILLDNILTGEVVYCLVQFYNIIQSYMCSSLPQALAMYAEVKISIGRLEEFLLLEEKLNITQHVSLKEEPGAIQLIDANANWIITSPTLINISLSIRPGALCCVLGNVGSGKSSLLQLFLKELPLTSGKLDITGKISYASQEPWLFVSSVKNNILFGQQYVKNKYADVVKVCALNKDFQRFPYGDKTLVGERGASLSGGQRARISLARSVYSEADIYLLDDPLSAVDTQVSRHLFEECILNYLKNKTRILVTHQLQFLKEADMIVIMDKGHISKIMTSGELSESYLNTLKEENISVHSTREHTVSSKIELDRNESLSPPSYPNHMEYEEKKPRADGEIIHRGVSYESYVQYFLFGTNICVLLILIIIFFSGQIITNACDLWITYWTNLDLSTYTSASSTPHAISADDIHVLPDRWSSFQNNSLNNFTHINNPLINVYGTQGEETNINESSKDITYIYIYAGFILTCIVLVLARSFLFYKICLNASRALHANMFSNVLQTPMRFFDANPSGRILNRFSKDMGAVDELLPYALILSLQIYLVMIGILLMVFIIIPWMIIPSILIGLIVYYTVVVYLSTVQSIKRLEGNSRSPVFSHISASLCGLSVIRSSNAEKMVKTEFDNLQDQHTSTWYMFRVCSQAFGFYLDAVVTVFLALVTFKFFIFKDENILGGHIGLAISSSMILAGMLQTGVKFTAEVVSNMISVERILDYTRIEKESTVKPSNSNELDEKWPQFGNISFHDTFVRYVPEEAPVLKDLNIKINSGEKIGIVGRTGAGKSSLIASLFRLMPIEGNITIDGIDTSAINFNVLRSNISIIPQEPVLFSGTIRYNLDPFHKVSDDVLWKALENVELRNSIESLSQNVSEGGVNFSAGQRQLICLARAIVRDNKILVMDEATANVDPHTDCLIQKTIRKNFANCTVLTIAHRLGTIMDSDKVLVMSFGKAVEFSHPYELLQKADGYFTKMVQETGSGTEETLRKLAFDSYKKK